ncbi:SDR family NAD(P)-dependent oxidoreductase [Roseicitreum antarcticum]|uniref:NAD(P)-dependent dehydrogenase, short-chain alcohol dehydrogenase family n=1 Tax=Roseicitreum antarcticum TaxID=564137 RepID=A0A1H2YQ04_9RHOB|nr:SDR family NAD(P)-dependent oxidoreductase [Roseicitreum antarcticum]SDX07313.1 NAD(P)-dependent dehydrogenase, short-chain alcohol dehydrogenase family [Roseicitreum antarcticum]
MPALQQMFDVAGKSVIVTGGASGIGKAYAEILAQQGAAVCIFDIDPDGLNRTVDGMTAQGWDVWGQTVDVSDREGMAKAFDAVAARHGRIDTVFANAGIDPGPGFNTPTGERNPDGAIENTPDEQWDRGIELNLTSVYVTVKNAVRHMKPAGGGQIIVTSSIAGMINESIVGTSYMPAKAAVNHFVRHMAMELGAYGIRVNAILPGPFITNIAGGRLRNKEDRAAFEAQSLIGRIGDVEDIKGIALLLASPAGAYFTGSLIVIDGGSLIRMT